MASFFFLAAAELALNLKLSFPVSRASHCSPLVQEQWRAASAAVGKKVEQGGGHLGITEDAGPFAEAEIGGDDDAGAFVMRAELIPKPTMRPALRRLDGTFAISSKNGASGVLRRKLSRRSLIVTLSSFVKAGLRSAADRKARVRLRYPSPGCLSASVSNPGIVCHVPHKNILSLP